MNDEQHMNDTVKDQARREAALPASACSASFDFMARKFSISPDVFSVQSIESLMQEWCNIPNNDAKKAIATEHQYYLFHRFLLQSVRHEDVSGKKNHIPIGLSIRVGAIKAGRLIVGSIAEAALRAHCDKRSIYITGKEERKTLGKIIAKLEKPEYEDAFGDIVKLAKRVHNARNDVHLYRRIGKPRDFAKLLESEVKILSDDDRLIMLLKGVIS